LNSLWVKILFCVILISSIFYGCKKEAVPLVPNDEIIVIPTGFPIFNFPSDNAFSRERWAFGKQLFYDKQLSKNNTVSCGTCHKQSFAFSDNVALSLGDSNALGTSNAPTLANVAYHPYYTRAGGVPTLEMQILVPIQEHNEFNTNMLDVVEKLKLNESYVKLARTAYNRELDPFVITRALANFERSLISGSSNFDDYFFKGNTSALNESEARGYQLFISSKTNCNKCHSGFNFTNYAFENNGLYLNYADSGRMRLTHLPEDRGKFKVATLRNIALTAPYMHDGSLSSLTEVIEHYASGGKNHVNKNSLVKPLFLTAQEKTDLVNFLHTLTDNSFITNRNFSQ
jgi:cytochrome c peroxidase